METVHLLPSSANPAHLQRSFEQAGRSQLRRINQLIQACLRPAFVRIGKPEPLLENLSGCWSRRIDDEQRLVYRWEGVHACDPGLPLTRPLSAAAQQEHRAVHKTFSEGLPELNRRWSLDRVLHAMTRQSRSHMI